MNDTNAIDAEIQMYADDYDAECSAGMFTQAKADGYDPSKNYTPTPAEVKAVERKCGFETLRVPGNEILVGDVMRFRMSKYDPIRWLKVVGVAQSGKRVSIALEGGAIDLVSIRNKSDWRSVRRGAVSL